MNAILAPDPPEAAAARAGEGRPAGKIVALANLKGGVGKTSLAVNLACASAVAGARTLLLDADPQQSARLWASRRPLPAEVRAHPLEREEELGAWLEVLQRARSTHDRIYLDLPAALTSVTTAAFLLADLVLVPTSAGALECHATARTLRHLARVRAQRPRRPLPALLVPNRIEGRAARAQRRLAALGEEVAPAVRRSGRIEAAMEAADWVGAITPRLAGISRDLRALHRAVEARLAAC